MVPRMSLIVVTVLVGCGDDGGARHPPDAPRADAQDDAPPDRPDAAVTITMGDTFAGGIGTLCGIAFDHTDGTIWGYGCNGATITHFSTAGATLGTLAHPGEAADDVDLDIASAPFTLGTASVAAGDLLFFNGETAATEVYLPAKGTDIALQTQYGASHVVGGSYHAARGTLFVVQDRNATTGANQIAELDATTGAVLHTFDTLPAFEINYGDVEVCQSSGNLFVVSSVEATLAVFTPAGTLVAQYDLPAGVTTPSGIGLDEQNHAAWISSTSGDVVRMLGVPCGS